MNSQKTSPATLKAEKALVAQQAGCPINEIEFIDIGWDSRIYYVFSKNLYAKFPRSEKVRGRYSVEIEALRLAGLIKTDVVVPELVYVAPANSFFLYRGVAGRSVKDFGDELALQDAGKIGRQLGIFLRDFHSQVIDGARTISFDDDIKQLHEWYQPCRDFLEQRLSTLDFKKIDDSVNNIWPQELSALSPEIRLCHRDFAKQNIYINNGEAGVIDFGDVGYSDISKDFVGLQNTPLFEPMIIAYGESDELRQKITLTSRFLLIIGLTYHLKKNESPKVEVSLKKIQNYLDQN